MDSLIHVLVFTCFALMSSGKCLSPPPLHCFGLSSPPGQPVTYKNRVTSLVESIQKERGAGPT